MEVICKKPISDTGGNILFYVGKAYRVLSQSANKQVMLKDEIGAFRWLPTDDSFFKQHFDAAKGGKK